MVGDSSGDISNEMRSLAALGFRVKSGWAAAVLLTGPVRSPQLCDVQRIDLSDPQLSETRQPYHAAMGKLETDGKKSIGAWMWCDGLPKDDCEASRRLSVKRLQHQA